MIPFQLWSWILTSLGVTGLFLSGSKKKIGWLIGLFVQVLWIWYAIATHQLGFVFSALAYGTVYARNYLKWKRESTPNPGVHIKCKVIDCNRHFYDGYIINWHGEPEFSSADTQLTNHLQLDHELKPGELMEYKDPRKWYQGEEYTGPKTKI